MNPQTHMPQGYRPNPYGVDRLVANGSAGTQGMDQQVKAIVDVERPEIESVLQRLSMCAAGLEDAVESIEKQLAPLVRPSNVAGIAGAGEVPPPQPTRCPLGYRIDELSDGIYAATVRLNELRRSLAL